VSGTGDCSCAFCAALCMYLLSQLLAKFTAYCGET